VRWPLLCLRANGSMSLRDRFALWAFSASVQAVDTFTLAPRGMVSSTRKAIAADVIIWI
jgi:hypothetical protein